MDFTDYPQSVQTGPFAPPCQKLTDLCHDGSEFTKSAGYDYRRDIFHLFFDTVVFCPVLATTHCQFQKDSDAPFSETPNYKQLT